MRLKLHRPAMMATVAVLVVAMCCFGALVSTRTMSIAGAPSHVADAAGTGVLSPAGIVRSAVRDSGAAAVLGATALLLLAGLGVMQTQSLGLGLGGSAESHFTAPIRV